MIILGIDPGVTTGLAAWDAQAKRLTVVTSGSILDMMQEAAQLVPALIVMEDARLRTWFGNAGREKLQGAGSIKRDCSIWTEWAERKGVPLKSIKPQAGATKWTTEHFQRLTGWTGRTNEHARDAALLVYGHKGMA